MQLQFLPAFKVAVWSLSTVLVLGLVAIGSSRARLLVEAPQSVSQPAALSSPTQYLETDLIPDDSNPLTSAWCGGPLQSCPK